jgi:hypothetical protein
MESVGATIYKMFPIKQGYYLIRRSVCLALTIELCNALVLYFRGMTFSEDMKHDYVHFIHR